MEKVIQIIEAKSNFREKKLFVSFAANISPLLASNTVQCCQQSTPYRNYKSIVSVNSTSDHDATRGRPTSLGGKTICTKRRDGMMQINILSISGL